MSQKNSPLFLEESAVFGHPSFAQRHLGSTPDQIAIMLEELGYATVEELLSETIPSEICFDKKLNLSEPLSEQDALGELEKIAARNQIYPSYLGMGYSGTLLPAVIRRNILENPGWYTAYTPYQAEISQGRLEALLNFQTMVTDLTGLPVANASMLDEATAAAEAMILAFGVKKTPHFFIDQSLHPQTKEVLRTRAEPLGVILIEGSLNTLESLDPSLKLSGGIIQYPTTMGAIKDPSRFVEMTHQKGGFVIAATDLLSLCLLKPPGEWGADMAIGSTQRFGVPLGYGGPHAAFFAVTTQLQRRLPGRLIGVSRDAEGGVAYRLTLQTREQHIRREKATSNICTAQVLLAVIASMYAIYHGPKGLTQIAEKIHLKALELASHLRKLGWKVVSEPFFDTVQIELSQEAFALLAERSDHENINLRFVEAAADQDNKTSSYKVIIALDETTQSVEHLVHLFGPNAIDANEKQEDFDPSCWELPDWLRRSTAFLTHPVFTKYHTETEMLRYMRSLEKKDLSLTTSMISLGSCTMKLNATAEMLPLSWESLSGVHPFVPLEQAKGYHEIFHELERWLAEITGFEAVSLQPNAGSQGEYAGLLVIRAYHHARGQSHRNICLIPTSAHGTNPASAVMAGMEIVGIACDSAGNIDVADLREKIALHHDNLAALMVTYPSTHGVFESAITEICTMVHEAGGEVYMDGANMNALVGLCRPGDFGADVCHLNLHKTFCIPHGGGGPGVGPIGVAAHLAPYLPGHHFLTSTQSSQIRALAAAPWGSASIVTISWMYIRMMGPEGLVAASKLAILHANYMAHRLAPFYSILYRGEKGRVAHECILDVREWKDRAGITVEDIAKRLIDYGFHAPTMSWPVAGTLMIEPTESESLEEMNRFCDALIAIHGELLSIERGTWSPADNPLKNAPHTATMVASDHWDHPYSRQQAVYPVAWLKEHKFWPAVARVDNVHGDRNLFCSCPPVEI